MENWFKDYFFKAYNWAMGHARAVETTKVRVRVGVRFQVETTKVRVRVRIRFQVETTKVRFRVGGVHLFRV